MIHQTWGGVLGQKLGIEKPVLNLLRREHGLGLAILVGRRVSGTVGLS